MIVEAISVPKLSRQQLLGVIQSDIGISKKSVVRSSVITRSAKSTFITQIVFWTWLGGITKSDRFVIFTLVKITFNL